MDRIDYLIETFRRDYPDADAAMLLEFAQHVRRAIIDELRDEAKDDRTPVKVSMQIHGMSFSANGPRAYVEQLLTSWQDAASCKNITPRFNRMHLISGR